MRAPDRLPEPDRPRPLAPSAARRLAELAIERNFFVLEDGVYADMRFEGERRRPLRELAPAHVIYVDSLSKVVGGGLRVGWVAARGPVRERIAMLKLESDFHTATLIQHIAARWLAHAAPTSATWSSTMPFYRERRDALMEALERHLPGEYQADAPAGGHHVWVTLDAPAGRARPLRRGRAPRRDLHARRGGDGGAPLADRRCGCRSRCSTRASSTRACAGWRARSARCAAARRHGGRRADVLESGGWPRSTP